LLRSKLIFSANLNTTIIADFPLAFLLEQKGRKNQTSLKVSQPVCRETRPFIFFDAAFCCVEQGVGYQLVYYLIVTYA
jgi:hypothetical protein